MENEVSKLDSPSWNSQICLNNSEWVAENVKGLDQSVKEMLLLIDNEEFFSPEKVANNDLKQPELIARVKEISERHHLLADHYNKLTGELSGGCVNSVNGLKKYEKPSFGSPLAPLFQTPDKKSMMNDVEGQVVGSDISLSSGGGISDTTPGSESSSLSSDSDSESYYTSRGERSSSLSSGKMMKRETIHMATEILDGTEKVEECEILQRRISDYERELKVSNEKLRNAEEEIAKLRSELRSSEAAMVKVGSLEAQLLSAKNQIKLHESELENENGRSLILQRQIVDLESNLESEKKQVKELQESVKIYTSKLSDRDLDIKKLNADLQDASGNFALEKWQLESSVSKLSEQLKFHEAKTVNLKMQCESLAEQIKKCEAGKLEMERNWKDDIERVKLEVTKKDELVNTLNKNLDGLKLKYDMLMAEKDGVIAKLQTLMADLSVRDNEIRRLEHNLEELHSENEVLNKLRDELKPRIDELEKEVKMQAAMISDTAEEKREAIRQLCFTLDHFRSAYVELREACVMRKGPTAVVS